MPDCLGTDPKTTVQKCNCQTETRQGKTQKKDREITKKKKKYQESHEKFRGKWSRWATGFNGARTGLGATSFASASASFGPRSGDKTRCPAKWILRGN